jgi:uncharacterized membrane protein
MVTNATDPTNTEPAMMPPEDPVQTRLYRMIERILDYGFFLGIGVILLGTVLTLAQGDDLPEDVVGLLDLPSHVADFEASALLDLGLIILLLTPLSYVVAALVTFIREQDRLFIGVCLLLIALIAASVGVSLI